MFEETRTCTGILQTLVWDQEETILLLLWDVYGDTFFMKLFLGCFENHPLSSPLSFVSIWLEHGGRHVPHPAEMIAGTMSLFLDRNDF